MATLFRLAREKCETAFAQYILSKKSGYLVTPVDVPVHVRRGKFLDGQFALENPDEIPLPSVVVSCPRTVVHAMGYPVCELHILVLGSADEDDATTRQPARIGTIAELFVDVDVDSDKYGEVLAYMNKPASGPDNRPVKDFALFGFYQNEEMGEETLTTLIDHLVFECHCLPTDDVDGDGQS